MVKIDMNMPNTCGDCPFVYTYEEGGCDNFGCGYLRKKYLGDYSSYVKMGTPKKIEFSECPLMQS